MGKYGFHSGYGEFQNIQSGTVTIGDGESSTSVTFDKVMKNIPAITLVPDSDVNVHYSAKSVAGFTAELSDPTGSVTVDWIAMDDAQNI